MNSIAVNFRSVQQRVVAAAARAGRLPSEVQIVAVTKTQAVRDILALYELGHRDFGENRVEEAEDKIGRLPKDITWHMIGHIQSRKAKRVLPLFHMVHSVDSVDLALRLDCLCAAQGIRLPVLVEVNVSGEGSKYGLLAQSWSDDAPQYRAIVDAVGHIVDLPHLRLDGMMTMAPAVADAELARPVFAELRRLRDALRRAFPQVDWRHLSMGMSDDFEVAVEEGATLLRIGRAIFSPEQAAACRAASLHNQPAQGDQI